MLNVKNKILSSVKVGLATAVLMAATTPAFAVEPKLVGKFGDWAVYTFMENGNKVCYMASQPKKAEGNYTRRGDIFALITHRPAEGTKNVFSYVTGYTYKSDSEVTVSVDSNNYKLFTQKDMAWTHSDQDDNALAQSIRAGSKMVVKGVSSRDTATTDTFSLSGSSAAHDKMSQECGVSG